MTPVEVSPTPTPSVTGSLTPSPTDTAPTPTPTPTEQSSTTPGTAGPTPTVTVTTTVTAEPSTVTAAAPTVTTTTHTWVTAPASTSSQLPWGLVLSAALVLVVGLATTVWLARRYRPATPPTPSVPSSTPVRGLLGFLVQLGRGMLDASTPAGQVNRDLLEVARVNGSPRAEIVSLPTALFVSLPDGGTAQTVAVSAGRRPLRLDQVQVVLEVAQEAQERVIDPDEGSRRLTSALAAPEPYPLWLRVVGYAAVSAGLSLLLGGGWPDLAVAVVLGVAVALALQLTTSATSGYAALVALGAAFAVSALVFLLARTGWPLVPLAALVPPLVTFLPGALLTTAAIDLATNQMVAGAARLASGGMQLVLLALGITAGAGLVGVPASLSASGSSPIGVFAPWLGVLLFGAGVGWHNGARRGSRRWILLVLVVAYAGQVLGGLVFGGVVSAFVGALAMTPVAAVVSTRPTGPPAMVSFLPGFWLLVPGALGLVGVTSVLGRSLDAALGTVVTAAVTMVSICLGVLVGLAVSTPLVRRLRVAPRATIGPDLDAGDPDGSTPAGS